MTSKSKKLCIVLLNKCLKRFGIVALSEKENVDYYLHHYNSYEEYRETQIKWNLEKINNVWADEKTLSLVAETIFEEVKKKEIKGICHGSRNGFEQGYFNKLNKGIRAIGTDISESATNYENSIVWDYHDVKKEFINNFDFVYTNALDQSWKPQLAVETWLNQINKNGMLIIEHTIEHGPEGSSEMDPFGVRPTVMPYILSKWFGHQISISYKISNKENKNKIKVWLFFIKKNTEKVVILESSKKI